MQKYTDFTFPVHVTILRKRAGDTVGGRTRLDSLPAA